MSLFVCSVCFTLLSRDVIYDRSQGPHYLCLYGCSAWFFLLLFFAQAGRDEAGVGENKQVGGLLVEIIIIKFG